MPELPEVETIARGLATDLAEASISGVRLLESGSLSTGTGALGHDEFLAELPGARILRVRRRAKVLFMDLATAKRPLLHLAFHLRMTGRLTVEPAQTEPRPHTRIVFDLADGRHLFFADVRKFGSCRAMPLEGLPHWAFWATLGPEPLEINAEQFAGLFKGRRGGIKALLLNQKFIAGIGNIYADESLFRAGIRPDAAADRVSRARLMRLHQELVEVLNEAIAANGSSISDYVNARGDAGAFQNDFRVYGRAGQPCRNCQTLLAKRTVAGRTTVFCHKCQR
ncbi:bifunctional DNA-formamidopyrimidine glycosylase/DNA-(apurinic or apyrimidinic site) lyase [Desulfovibrio ferrophilus]|uniref:Formamidopyrimidine-DNA glycosylase n=1 Tax=Desulfovibrio ferrophilus TaxID=241368 RepID=A0A2Z6B096_9BACT|nr:bifunctional DNA-formamidopyrimidine glycosylase/DNA-(apurinic or apyrimidinic site) lyase [Desulfovibrio ferrophilus]BBD08816.1 formamidopyrimidine-DNA glycosylase [Desulfovibrio ferrophilus]